MQAPNSTSSSLYSIMEVDPSKFYLNVSQSLMTEANNPMTMIIKLTQGILTFMGLVGNILVVVVLRRHRYMARFASCVFLHQSILDLLVCVISIIVILIQDDSIQTMLHDTGWTPIDFIICHIWTSQCIYWYFVFLSVQNLVLIALDRYWAVFKPMRYKSVGYRQAAVYIISLHFYSIVINSADVLIVRYDSINRTCLNEPLFPGTASKQFFVTYGILWFFLVYLIPSITVVLLYGVIVFRLTRNKNEDNLAFKNRQRAAHELTKTSVIITVIFIFCFSYDSIYYLLGNLGVFTYTFNTPMQTMGVFLVALNSCVNPVVYCITMRTFRLHMTATICCYKGLTEGHNHVSYYPTVGSMSPTKRPCNALSMNFSPQTTHLRSPTECNMTFAMVTTRFCYTSPQHLPRKIKLIPECRCHCHMTQKRHSSLPDLSAVCHTIKFHRLSTAACRLAHYDRINCSQSCLGCDVVEKEILCANSQEY